MITLNDIKIRTELKPGDLGYITFLHGTFYKEEYNFGMGFEAYVAGTLYEFYGNYDPARERFWICEYKGEIIGSLLLMSRGEAAQLRYFVILPPYQGIGLGKKLMSLYMDFFHACRYKSAYLWTTTELAAAASLYTRHGFRMVEEKESTRFGKRLKEQKYELTIRETMSEWLNS